MSSTSSEDSEDDEPSFRKVLATLIRIDKHKSILDFMKHDPPINDQVLPLYMVHNLEGRRCGLALGSSKNTPIAFTTGWTIDDCEKFLSIQWRLYPTFFAVEGNKDDNDGHKKVHYECHPETILPFVYRPSPTSTWNHPGPVSPRQDPIIGGFSIVSFHELHRSQQNLRRYTTEGADRKVAVKRLITPNRDEFDKELKMLIKLTPLQTPHLAKLLATFEIQGKSATERDFCFMSEKADSSLQDFWKQEPDLLNAPPAALRRWVAQQCRGLAEGMQLIHDYRYEQQNELQSKIGAAPTPKHGFHGDIKPGNILVYNTWSGHKHPLGILQITDFGISSFHHTASLSGISRGRDTHSYRPPESNLPFMKTTQSHDIWTLGCLFLDFLTWLVKGTEAIADFQKKRISFGFSDNEAISTFYQVDGQNGRTVISISDEVLAVSQNAAI
ncbi:Protein kinase-like domain containing protein [Rhypophila decipiens]